jgi:hypothetical protein
MRMAEPGENDDAAIGCFNQIDERGRREIAAFVHEIEKQFCRRTQCRPDSVLPGGRGCTEKPERE